LSGTKASPRRSVRLAPDRPDSRGHQREPGPGRLWLCARTLLLYHHPAPLATGRSSI